MMQRLGQKKRNIDQKVHILSNNSVAKPRLICAKLEPNKIDLKNHNNNREVIAESPTNNKAFNNKFSNLSLI